MRQLSVGLPVILIGVVALELLAREHLVSGSVMGLLRWVVLLPFVFAVFRVLLPRALTTRSMILLDRHHRLEGRLSNALIFSKPREQEPSTWERLAIVDGLQTVSSLQPAETVPLVVPRAIGYSVVVAVLWAGVGHWPVRSAEPVVVEAKSAPPEVLSAEDLDWLREEAERIARQPLTVPVAKQLSRYRELLDGVSNQGMGRGEAFRRLAELAADLRPAALGALELGQALRAAAGALQGARLSRPVAEALSRDDWGEAAAVIRKLAERLGEETPPNAAERAALGRALRQASDQSKQRAERLRDRRRRLMRKRLLNNKGNGSSADASSGPQRPSPSDRRQLRRLGSEQSELDAAAETLSELDRQLAEAARQLLDQLGGGADSLREAAEQLEAMNRRRLTEEQKRALKRQLEQMRRMLRESAAGGEQRRRRLAQLERRAAGGPQGPSKAGRHSRFAEPEPGAKMVPIPLPRRRAAAESGRSSRSPLPGSGPGGVSSPPEGGVAAVQKDARAVALDTGEGLASTEVVYGAAARGFASESYQKIHRDYQTVAEEVLSRDRIPPGYEHSVRRYFQLIRPRPRR